MQKRDNDYFKISPEYPNYKHIINVKLRILSITPNFICRIIYNRETQFRSFLHCLFPNLQIMGPDKRIYPIYY